MTRTAAGSLPTCPDSLVGPALAEPPALFDRMAGGRELWHLSSRIP